MKIYSLYLDLINIPNINGEKTPPIPSPNEKKIAIIYDLIS